MEAAAVTSRQDQWIEPSSAPDQPQAGLVHPFYHDDELMGLLTIGRRHSTEPLNAGQVNIIHTFSEFFAQQVLSRRHAEAAMTASVAHREIELAAEIQRSLLPSQFPDIPGITLAGHCESALTVGGDFYDVIPWTTHGFFFIVADVMGKGVGASMMAAVTRSVFRSLNQLYQTPARAMERAARLLFEDLDRLEMLVTAAVGVVDLHLGVVRLANAGHCPVLVALPDGTVVSAEPSIAPLGLEKSPDCAETTVPFPPGSHLLIYSDGLVDPRDLRSPFPSPDEAGEWLAKAAPRRKPSRPPSSPKSAAFPHKAPPPPRPTNRPSLLSPVTHPPLRPDIMARLIIAEDSAHMLRLLEMTLRKGGHTWTSCNDGTEVLAAAAKEVPELFILDVIMPIMDGLAALTTLKSIPATAAVPVIMLTARGQSLTRQQAQESGAALFLTKPFSPTELLAAIDSLTTPKP